ncbi:MAG: TonB-dependent receptor [Deltaproteobacteria bacterium]|nr:MAG: TonB-dependent receptor [Deltaproteobacteria bacterium]
MKKTISVALGLCCAASPLWTSAEEQQPLVAEEMVVTATRSSESLKTIPTKIELINEQEIDLTVGQTITEQLKKSSSIGVIEYPGALAGIGIRGFRPEFSGITKHSLILIDGRPAGATNLATVLKGNIERIEVLKGPASSLYGAEAMGGVVNIITKRTTEKLKGEIGLGYGSFNTNIENASIGGMLGEQFDFDLSVSRYDQQDNIKVGDDGDERPNTSYETRSADLRVGTNMGADWRLDVSANLYQGLDVETPGDVYDGVSNSGRKDLDNYGIDLTLGGVIGANEIEFTGYVTGEESEYYKYYLMGEKVPDYRSYSSEITWYGTQLKDVYRFGDHKLIGGLDYQYIEKKSKSYKTSGARKAPWSPDEGRTNIAGYLESVWKLFDTRLTLTAGGRYDFFDVETLETPYKTDFTPNSETFSWFSPRAGVNYTFDSGIRLHATVGQAFVPPSAGELAGYSERVVGDGVMITKGNSGLDPENSTTVDMGLGFVGKKSGFTFDVTWFYTDVNDRISRVTKGNVTTYENSLGAEIEGLEMELGWDVGTFMELGRSVKFYVNTTNIVKAEEDLAGGSTKDIHNVADYTYNYGIMYDDGMIDGNFHFRSQGEMRDTDWNALGYPELEYPAFTVADLVVGVNFMEKHRIALTVDNIFDEDYYEKKGFPKPGRAFYVNYTFSF